MQSLGIWPDASMQVGENERHVLHGALRSCVSIDKLNLFALECPERLECLVFECLAHTSKNGRAESFAEAGAVRFLQTDKLSNGAARCYGDIQQQGARH